VSNLERWRSEFDRDARVYRRFEQFTATTSGSSIACLNAQVEFIRHRDAAGGRQYLTAVLDRSDGWQDVCPFAFLELENGLDASGNTAPGAVASDRTV
jgi:hypothetical protein